jgi:hypothetical protein
VEVDVWDYLGGAGAWVGRVGGLVFGLGLALVCWGGVDGCGRDFRKGRRPEGRMWIRRKIREWEMRGERGRRVL